MYAVRHTEAVNSDFFFNSVIVLWKYPYRMQISFKSFKANESQFPVTLFSAQNEEPILKYKELHARFCDRPFCLPYLMSERAAKDSG